MDPNLDTDGDGIPDFLDGDDDNDGIPDEEDEDANGDGIPDVKFRKKDVEEDDDSIIGKVTGFFKRNLLSLPAHIAGVSLFIYLVLFCPVSSLKLFPFFPILT